jgi:hypothetical protein
MGCTLFKEQGNYLHHLQQQQQHGVKLELLSMGCTQGSYLSHLQQQQQG